MSDSSNYYTVIRKDVFPLVPECNRILDVGCATGVNLKILKDMGRCKETYGIEYVAEVAKIAESNIDNIICCDITTTELPYPDKYFDVIMCLDVLEHLADPWSAVQKLRKVLTDDGVLIASIPNIAFLTVILKIILGRFEYQESGVLDRTHLRFFTLRTMKKMFTDNGFSIVKVKGSYTHGWKMYLLYTLTLGLGVFWGAFQYKIVVKKNT